MRFDVLVSEVRKASRIYPLLTLNAIWSQKLVQFLKIRLAELLTELLLKVKMNEFLAICDLYPRLRVFRALLLQALDQVRQNRAKRPLKATKLAHTRLLVLLEGFQVKRVIRRALIAFGTLISFVYKVSICKAINTHFACAVQLHETDSGLIAA